MGTNDLGMWPDTEATSKRIIDNLDKMVQAVRDSGKKAVLFNVPNANEAMFPPAVAKELREKRDYHNARLKRVLRRAGHPAGRHFLPSPRRAFCRRVASERRRCEDNCRGSLQGTGPDAQVRQRSLRDDPYKSFFRSLLSDSCYEQLLSLRASRRQTPGDGRNPRQPWYRVGDFPPNQQAGQEPAVVDSFHDPVCPLGLGRIGAAAWEAEYGVLGQGAEGNPRFGTEAGFPCHVLLDREGPSLSSQMAQRHWRQGTSRPTTRDKARCRFPTWTIPSS